MPTRNTSQRGAKWYLNQNTGEMHLPHGANVNVEDSAGHAIPCTVRAVTETVPVTAFTDGGSTVGTYVMAVTVPKGALILATKVIVDAGFAGNVSATLTVGDGTDVDRYMTGTPSVFATAADGLEVGVPSGSKLLTADNTPTLTVTTSSDFTAALSNASGIVTVTIFYIDTV